MLLVEGACAWFPKALCLGVDRVGQGGGQEATHRASRPPPAHLDGREHEAHDEVGEPVHSPVHHEGGRPGGLQEDLGPHHRGDGTLRAESTGPVGRSGLGGALAQPPDQANPMEL